MPSHDPLLLEEEEELSSRAIQQLRSTSRWVRFFGVLGFVVSLLSIISLINPVSALFDSSESGVSTIWILLELAFTLVSIGLSFYISFMLFSYGSTTKKFTETTDYNQLEIAFKRQLIYWRWTGISVSILLGLYVLYFAIFLIIGMNQGML
ncbi:MAG: hypothetical protein AB8E82_09865 [Aureispira sp.]